MSTEHNSQSNNIKLKSHLFEEYGGFADKRIKNLSKSNRFIVDDRDKQCDYGANNELYSWFCPIIIEVNEDSSIQVLLFNFPTSRKILGWINAGNAIIQDSTCLVITVGLQETSLLREYASYVSDIVKPGNTYSVPSYKYVCPRTAQSLCRLVDVLEEFNCMVDGFS